MAGSGANDTGLVVLVHGLGRTPLSMLPLAWSLRRAGFRVLNFGYSSCGPSVAQIGQRLARVLARERPDDAGPVHFVGHSLGNIVIRWLIARQRPRRLGRVVMLAPPNRGSRLADRLAPYLGRLLPPIRELGTGSGTAVELAPPRDVEFAVIAGRRDRKVRVEETRLAGAAAHVVVPAGHTFIMMRRDVRRLVLRFLREGTCKEASAALVAAADTSGT